MSLALLLASLRPLMTKPEVERVLGLGPGELNAERLRSYDLDHGVMIDLDPQGKLIERVFFTMRFSQGTPVEGLWIGMDAPAVIRAFPDLALPPGASGLPNEHGWVTYEGGHTAEGFEIYAGFRHGELRALELGRPGLAEMRAERKRLQEKQAEEWRLARERAERWKSIEDPDAMLEDWAAHCSPWGGPSDRFIAFARWLRAATPDERHAAALSWNWDYGLAPLLWLIRQPDCDKATALVIFFNASPSFYVQYGSDRAEVPGHALEVFDLLVEIRRRFASGFYTRSKIAFDGDAGMALVRRAARDAAVVEALCPREAGWIIPGRRVSRENDFDGLRVPDFETG